MVNEVNKVVIIGIGGGAAYYVGKIFCLLHKNVTGYDMKETQRTQELAALGADIHYENPTEWHFPDADLIIYSTALPKEFVQKLLDSNKGKNLVDTGSYYQNVLDDYEAGKFSKHTQVLNAIKESNIAPLYDIDFGPRTLIGVTGSKGKTTTSQMIYNTLTNLCARVSLVNTIGGMILDKKIETGLHTSTPSSQELAEIFRQMISKGSDIIVVETSSHAIATGRIAGLKFDFAVITNIQPEHLDFHKTIEHVIETKKKLITKHLKQSGTAILNMDDQNIKKFVYKDATSRVRKVFTISILEKIETTGHYFASNIKENDNSISFSLTSQDGHKDTETYTIPFAGEFNVYNSFPSIIIARELGYTNIAPALSQLSTVSGRNEVLQTVPFKVVLDFAHTPESLEQILRTYRVLPSTKKLIVVFGAAGQRDTIKRPRMGTAAAKFADITILTAEDPRTEDLSAINDQIEAGWLEYVQKNNLHTKRTLLRVEDISRNELCRRDAIEKALSLASTGDVVICAGKGPEKSMCFGFDEKAWDEKAVILDLLAKSSLANKVISK